MSNFQRVQHLDRAQREEFDVVIIGGGITGAGIARDAAMRGLKAIMLEARDFSSGTSSKSSKLLHGGIRYLEQFHFSLVFEASQERRLHSDLLSPHLAAPVPFMIPVYPWSPHRWSTVCLGVFLYDMLALFRNHGSRYLFRGTTENEEDRIEKKGLQGSVVYHDVVMDDSRITIENVRSAAFHGAVTLNYCGITSFGMSGGKIASVNVKDSVSGKEFEVKGRTFINAAGPWSDKIRRMADPKAEPQLRPTKGTHFLLPKNVLGRKHAFVLTAKKDNRVFFSIPWFDRTLVGTTDTDYKPEVDGPLEDIQPTANERDYLMESVKRTFPESTVVPEDIISSFAGLRPLVSQGQANPSALSREHRIWRENNGLFNIAGGKYTTYRTMAAEILDLVLKEEGHRLSASKAISTQGEPLVMNDRAEGIMLDYSKELGMELIAHLQARYGARWQRVADLALERKETRIPLVKGEQDILAEAIYAKESEMAVEMEDFLRRRTMLSLKTNLSANMDGLNKVAQVFDRAPVSSAEVLKWQGKS